MLQTKPQCARGLACVSYECRVYVPSPYGLHFWVLGEWCKVASLRQGDSTRLSKIGIALSYSQRELIIPDGTTATWGWQTLPARTQHVLHDNLRPCCGWRVLRVASPAAMLGFANWNRV